MGRVTEVYVNIIISGRLAAVALGLILAALGSCDFGSTIPGNVAGQLINEAGQGQGFIAVQLVDTSNGQVAYSMNADDQGNFMFKGVETGVYKIKTVPIGGGEIASDAKEFRLTPGKTINITVTLYRGGAPDTSE
jgi:hypothetical protein